MVPAKTAVDHLLLGEPDLDRGIAWLEQLTGVKAVAGGSHPGMGTRNALVSLGPGQYLEIIAPDPAQTIYNFQIDVTELPGPRLVNWAARTGDVATVADRARTAGFPVFGPRDGSRARPDGKLLKWKIVAVMNALGSRTFQPVPFFIQWAADSVHPSEDSPKGCALESFTIEHRDPAGVTDTLTKLGIEAVVTRATLPRLVATLNTPKGSVTLT